MQSFFLGYGPCRLVANKFAVVLSSYWSIFYDNASALLAVIAKGEIWQFALW